MVKTKEETVVIPKEMYLEMLKLLPRARQVEVVKAVESLTAEAKPEIPIPDFVAPPENGEASVPREKAARRFGHQTFYKPGKDRRKEGTLGRFG